MNFRAVFHLISFLVLFTTMGQYASWGIALLYHDPVYVQTGLLQAAFFNTLFAALLWAVTRGPIDLTRRDGFGIVTFGWLMVAHTGALPYVLTASTPDAVTALFETMSGYTATGSTAIEIVEDLPYGILFWRSLTQWFGGMGIIVLAVAILPFLGVGGMQLFSAEMSGPSKDRLTPRIESTAKLLWGVYLALTLIAFLAFHWAGLNWFDALNHAFTAVATGGFSTRTASVAAYDSVAVEMVFVVVMLIGGISFPLHYRALTGYPKSYFKDPQIRFYFGLWGITILIIALNLIFSMGLSPAHAFRDTLFQVTTLLTSTGFVSADYNQWPALSRGILLFLMICGGCAGSTAGGVKVIRFLVLFKKALREIRLFMQPEAVVQVKVAKKTVTQDIISKITSYFVIYMLVWGVATLIMTLFLPDLKSAFSSVVSALGNMGPGFGSVGAVQNYAHINAGGKITLTFVMLLGRLELFTVLVLFLPRFWRK